MNNDLAVLAATAVTIGFLHTLFGPDHYLPFIMMARAQGWSRLKTMSVTFFCGIGHVLSSVVLGMVGVALGIAIQRLVDVESIRGNLAAWGLISFGLAYCVWGIRRALQNRPHTHRHLHEDGAAHEHTHTHREAHAHAHEEAKKPSLTPWVLFTVFVLGPCEPLIPILMYPAAKNSIWGLLLVTGAFAAVTLTTMMTVVAVSSWGLKLLPLGRLERYTHALAGGTICLSGLAIQFLGL